MRLFLLALTILTISSCGNTEKKTQESTDSSQKEQSNESQSMNIKDPHSYAELDVCKVDHLDWQIDIDFKAKKLKGVASWTLKKEEGADKVIFDTKGLKINGVELDGKTTSDFEVGPDNETFGAPLTVEIKPETKVVSIAYETTNGAEALMWLNPEQTAGKIHPFLFTQSQAILARTWIPCQDGPGVRYTYTAKVSAPKELMVAMSAENPQEKSEDGVYNFKMTQPVPSYLMALVCGDLEFRNIGNRTGVYAEPELIDAAEYELGDMQNMLEKAEKLYGDYRWERYDVVFLPPSFPFGGMENPRLTFATPTIIAGDRSLTALIAHELAHSWSGNLVTNATWNDFWLNEGFTVYFEQRIMEALYGREYSEMLALLSYQGLLDEIEEFKKNDALEETHLKLDLEGRNPDDGLTSIAYDKGYLFLRMLEENFGRERFDSFLKKYFSENAFKVMTTEQFVEYLDEHLLSKDREIADACQIDAWIYGPGLPDNCPTIESKKLAALDNTLDMVYEQREMKLNEIDTAGWTAHEYIYFVANLPDDLNKTELAKLDKQFQFTKSTNAEILGKWFIRVAEQRYAEGYDALEKFLVSVGRRKFLTPIYLALKSSDEGLKQAKSIYKKARPNYHAVARNTLDEILNYNKN